MRRDQVPSVWWYFRPMIHRALAMATAAERANGWHLDGLLTRLLDGSMQMWTAGDDVNGIMSVAITEIVDTPEGRIAAVPIVAGDDLDAWLHHVRTIEEWAIANRCDYLQGQGRKGWRRALKRYGWDIATTRPDGVMQIRKAL